MSGLVKRKVDEQLRLAGLRLQSGVGHVGGVTKVAEDYVDMTVGAAPFVLVARVERVAELTREFADNKLTK